MLGSGRDKIETKEQMEASKKVRYTRSVFHLERDTLDLLLLLLLPAAVPGREVLIHSGQSRVEAAVLIFKRAWCSSRNAASRRYSAKFEKHLSSTTTPHSTLEVASLFFGTLHLTFGACVCWHHIMSSRGRNLQRFDFSPYPAASLLCALVLVAFPFPIPCFLFSPSHARPKPEISIGRPEKFHDSSSPLFFY